MYNGCKFWYWEEEYIDILIECNLVDVLALLASIYARLETRCKEATSTSLHSKKKEARKIEPLQINNACIKKILIQLTEAIMKVGYLLKCLFVVVVLFGLTILVKIW